MWPHRVSQAEREVISKEIEKMLLLGVIEEAEEGAWASPMLIVPKPNQRGWRPVVDFRRLNK
jgi:hypothetical protein